MYFQSISNIGLTGVASLACFILCLSRTNHDNSQSPVEAVVR